MPPLDRVLIGPFRAEANIGWFEEERKTPQPLLIELTFSLDTKQAGTSDELVHTVDYDIVVPLREMIRLSRRKLVETVAEDIATYCLAQTQATSVVVRVTKYLPFDPSITGSVEITRAR